MKRSITGFHRDAEGDWVADLDCGHGQHVRHRPPFQNRPWAVDKPGRDNMLGVELDCRQCDRMEWPDGVTTYRRTPEFDESTLPRGLLSDHATKKGVWGRVHVLAGRLVYHVGAPINTSLGIVAGSHAVVVPEVRHRVEADGAVRFFIEFSHRAR